MNTNDLFETAYAETNRAADLAQRMSAEDAVTLEHSAALVHRLTLALCSARELNNRLAGNPPPRRGE